MNREDYEVGGGSSTVDATSWDASVGYEVESSPSMRMVVDLADLDASRWISMTGVSGHPASGHYVDQTDLWVEGETLPWPFTRAAVDGGRRGHADPRAGREEGSPPVVARSELASRERAAKSAARSTVPGRPANRADHRAR